MLLFLTGVLLLGGLAVYRTLQVARDIGQLGSFERVRSILVRRMGASRESVARDAELASLRPHGLDTQELVLAVEEELQIHIPEEESASLVTVQDLVDTVDRHIR